MKKRDTGPLFSFFWAQSKAVPLNTKNGEDGHRAFFFCRFCSTSKAVSRCIKNEAEGHRASFLVFGRTQKRCHETAKMAQRDTGP